MTLPLDETVKFGLMTRVPSIEAGRRLAGLLDRLRFDSLWVGDHVAFTLPILDPFVQLTTIATLSPRLTVGTAVYLLPLRHPVPVAKQTSSLDQMTGGRFIFGVGVGGEFPKEYAACGVPREERGARLTESVEVLRKLWKGEPVSHQGRFFSFPEIHMQPATVRPGGPPIWFGGRQPAALKRAGRIGDGYISYVITPEMFRSALETITAAAEEARREVTRFGTAHLLFCRIDDSYETAWDDATALLSKRYAMDFRGAAKKYAAMGRPADIAETLNAFHRAGVRHFNLDLLGSPEERDAQLERFATEVRPLLEWAR